MAALLGASIFAAVLASAFADVIDRPPCHLQLYGRAQLIAVAVVEHALQRLESPSCQLVLSDFRDPGGRALADNLEATGLTLREFVSRLRLVDGDAEVACTNNQANIAFTSRGSRVVHVCSGRFAAMFSERPLAETLVIHEILHTLGLGEAPPSSQEITRQVWRRCVLR